MLGTPPWAGIGEDTKPKTSPVVQNVASRLLQAGRQLDSPTSMPPWAQSAFQMPESRLRASDLAGGFSYDYGVNPDAVFQPRSEPAATTWAQPGAYKWSSPEGGWNVA
jgi:hypothetical protein